jgi:flavin-dependent dehydrogenase
MRRALDRFAAAAPGLDGAGRPSDVERRGGPIPVGGLLRRIAGADGLLVGDAAGAVSPLTAGGLDPCLRLSDHAVDVLDHALRAGRCDLADRYDGAALRASFRGRLVLRRGLAQVRTPAVATALFPLLRTSLGRSAARRILFGDRSFPTPATRGVANHSRHTRLAVSRTPASSSTASDPPHAGETRNLST